MYNTDHNFVLNFEKKCKQETEEVVVQLVSNLCKKFFLSVCLLHAFLFVSVQVILAE